MIDQEWLAEAMQAHSTQPDPTRSVDPPPKGGQHGPGRGPGAPGGPAQPKNGQPGGGNQPGQARPAGQGQGQGGQGNRSAGPDATVLAAAQQQQKKPGDPKQGRPDAEKGERGSGGPSGPDRAGRSPSASRSG